MIGSMLIIESIIPNARVGRKELLELGIKLFRKKVYKKKHETIKITLINNLYFTLLVATLMVQEVSHLKDESRYIKN